MNAKSIVILMIKLPKKITVKKLLPKTKRGKNTYGKH